MGCYVNPKNENKEIWLAKNGQRMSEPPPISDTHLPVCLVDNGHFLAAGVAYDQGELDAFADEDDERPKIWFRVSREKLRTVSDLAEYENNS